MKIIFLILLLISLNTRISRKLKSHKLFKSDIKDCYANDSTIDNLYNDKFSHMTLKRLKFVHGNCPPVILVPGLLGNALYLHISDCYNFLKNVDEGFKYHCAFADICSNNSEQHNEKMWPTISGNFGLNSSKNLKGLCLAYFMQYFNDKESCPKEANCRYSEYVRIVPFDPVQYTKDYKSIFKSVSNIFDIFGFNNGIFNSKSSAVYNNLINELVDIGYEENFSLNVIPYDYKESICNNKQFASVFEKVIDEMHEVTKKKVVIIAYSYGGYNSLYQITNNKNVKSKIEEFIIVASPLLGSSKTIQLLFKGDKKDYNFSYGMELSVTAQKIIFSRIPVTYQLLPVSIQTYLKDNPSLLKDIKLRIFKEQTIVANENEANSCNYLEHDDLHHRFKENFDLTRLNTITEEEVNHFKKVFYNKTHENITFCNLPCNFNFYNQFDYDPVSLVLSQNFNGNKIKAALNKKTEDKKENFNFNKINYLMMHDQISDDFIDDLTYFCGKLEKNSKSCYSYFIKEYTRQSDYEKSNRIFNSLFHQCRDFKEKLEDPGVKTTLIFNKTFITRSGFVFDLNDPLHQDMNKYFYSGGDGSVPSESIIIPGLKWSESNKEIKFVDFCSNYIPTKGNSVNGIGYNLADEAKYLNDKYVFLNCEKKGDDPLKNQHNKNKSQDSKHGEMIGDIHFVKYISLKMRNSYKYDHKKIDWKLLSNSGKIRNIFFCAYLFNCNNNPI